MKIVLFNGPPGCGKDTAAAMVAAAFDEEYYTYHKKFAGPLKAAINALFDIPEEQAEELKDRIDPLWKRRLRDEYIWFSEACCKPRFGNDFFGVLMMRELNAIRNAHLDIEPLIAISDSGFSEEVEALLHSPHINESDILLVQIHREGCDFVGDSRSYINPAIAETGITVRRLDNVGAREDFEMDVVNMVGLWLDSLA